MSQPRPTVLVTGAAVRVGAAIAAAFAEAGWHVALHCNRSLAQAEALAARLPSAEVIAADLTDAATTARLVDDCAARFSDWRALVCSAGVFAPDEAEGLSRPVFDQAIATNTLAPILLAQAYLRRARAAEGRRAILVTDQKLANPNPDFFSYSLSKHALGAAIPMLAMAQTDPLDRIYGLAPGAILPSHDQTLDEIEVSHRLNLLERKTAAHEVAQAAVFLAGGALASGETLFVDSGQHLLAQPRDVIFLAREAAGSA